jgi:hypothetical protein
MHPHGINEARTSFWALDLENQFVGHQGLPFLPCWSFTFEVMSRTVPLKERVNSMEDLKARITRGGESK